MSRLDFTDILIIHITIDRIFYGTNLDYFFGTQNTFNHYFCIVVLLVRVVGLQILVLIKTSQKQFKLRIEKGMTSMDKLERGLFLAQLHGEGVSVEHLFEVLKKILFSSARLLKLTPLIA